MLLFQSAIFAQNKDTKKEPDKKPTWESDAKIYKITKVDIVKSAIIVTDPDKKELTLNISKDTAFYGPKGGVSKEKIKDDRVAVGKEIQISLGKDGKTVEYIVLAAKK
jgi:hypothetical protein